MRAGLGRGRSLQAGVTTCCLIAFFLYGYDQGVFGGILQNKAYQDQFNHPSDTKTGIIVASYNLGAVLGCIVNFLCGERAGRRRIIWAGCIFITIGAILQTTAYGIPHLIVGRIVCGFGSGMKTSTVPMYQAELCDRRYRGRLISAEIFFIGGGISFAYWFDFGMSYKDGEIAWRLPIALQIPFALAVIGLVFYLPESPRWLFNHGYKEEAVEVLSAVFGKDADDDFILREKAAIEQAIELEHAAETSKSFMSIVRNDEVKTGHRVLLAFVVQFMNQFSGVNLIVYYIPSVLVQSVGLSTRLAQVLSGCVTMMLMFGVIVPVFYLDQMGRRKTMILGQIGAGVCMLLIAALLSQAHIRRSFAIAAVPFFFLFMFIFGVFGVVSWCYVPEIQSLASRARGTAIGVSSNWLWNFTIGMISPILINRLKWKTYLIFMATNLAFAFRFWAYFPETGNFRLEDIDHIFAGDGDPVKKARELTKKLKSGAEMGEAEALSVPNKEAVAE